MPARNFRSPVAVAVAGAPPAETVGAALSLLALFGDPAAVKQAKATLAAMQAAAKANAEAMAGFGPAEHIVELEAEAEAARERARDELERARVEAKRLVADGKDRVAASQAELAAERGRLEAREAAVVSATTSQPSWAGKIMRIPRCHSKSSMLKLRS